MSLDNRLEEFPSLAETVKRQDHNGDAPPLMPRPAQLTGQFLQSQYRHTHDVWHVEKSTQPFYGSNCEHGNVHVHVPETRVYMGCYGSTWRENIDMTQTIFGVKVACVVMAVSVCVYTCGIEAHCLHSYTYLEMSAVAFTLSLPPSLPPIPPIPSSLPPSLPPSHPPPPPPIRDSLYKAVRSRRTAGPRLSHGPHWT